MAMSPFLRRSLVGAGVGAAAGALTAEPGKGWEGATTGGMLGAAGGMGYHHFKGTPRPQGALPAGKAPLALGAGPAAAPPSPRSSAPAASLAGGAAPASLPPGRAAPPPPRGGAAPPPGGSANYRQQGPVGADAEWLKGVSSQAEAKKRFRQQAKQHHPDAGGTTAGMQGVNAQWDAYKATPAYGRMATAAYDDGTTDAWEFFMRGLGRER